MDNTQNTQGTEPVKMVLMVFGKDGIEVKLINMDTVPLVMVERGQHLTFREIMVSRKKSAYKVQGKREAGWEQPQRKVSNV